MQGAAYAENIHREHIRDLLYEMDFIRRVRWNTLNRFWVPRPHLCQPVTWKMNRITAKKCQKIISLVLFLLKLQEIIQTIFRINNADSSRPPYKKRRIISCPGIDRLFDQLFLTKTNRLLKIWFLLYFWASPSGGALRISTYTGFMHDTTHEHFLILFL